jgi:hypothetical protein
MEWMVGMQNEIESTRVECMHECMHAAWMEPCGLHACMHACTLYTGGLLCYAMLVRVRRLLFLAEILIHVHEYGARLNIIVK